MRHINVDEVAKEEHEACLQSRNPLRQMLEPRNVERVLERIIGEASLNARGMQKSEWTVLEPATFTHGRSGREEAGVIVHRILIASISFQASDSDAVGEVCLCIAPRDPAGLCPSMGYAAS